MIVLCQQLGSDVQRCAVYRFDLRIDEVNNEDCKEYFEQQLDVLAVWDSEVQIVQQAAFVLGC